jgi:CRP/FNR family transcriptional regulator, cyclic AMP receptor protein
VSLEHIVIDAVSGASPLVGVLEADPDLGTGIAHDQLHRAKRASVARVMEFEGGRLRAQPPDDGLGGLILDGLLLVRVDFARIRGNVELLGPGDVISPWLGMAGAFTPAGTVTARVLMRLRVAWLDSGFAVRTGQWPEIQASLMRRLLARSRRLSLQSAINSLPRIEERVELTLWQLAYRFGHMSQAGVKLDLPLTHTHLAEMVCAQRPSVSTAITRLRSRGLIVVTARGQWLLSGSLPPQLAGRIDGFDSFARRLCDRGPTSAGQRVEETDVPDVTPGSCAETRAETPRDGRTKPHTGRTAEPRTRSPGADRAAPRAPEPSLPGRLSDGGRG